MKSNERIAELESQVVLLQEGLHSAETYTNEILEENDDLRRENMQLKNRLSEYQLEDTL